MRGVKLEIPDRGLRVDLHGLQLKITTLIKERNHEQHCGTLSKLKANGVEVLEELTHNNGRRCARQQTARRFS